MTAMGDERYWERIVEMHGEIKEINANVNAIRGNCERNRCILEDHEQRIRVVEREQGNVFKMIMRPILGIFGIRI